MNIINLKLPTEITLCEQSKWIIILWSESWSYYIMQPFALRHGGRNESALGKNEVTPEPTETVCGQQRFPHELNNFPLKLWFSVFSV
jgi:hypothetical protein